MQGAPAKLAGIKPDSMEFGLSSYLMEVVE